MTDVINLNVVGAGYWSPKLIRNLLQIPSVRIRTLCDLNPDQVDRIRKQFPEIAQSSTNPVATVTDSHADAVLIATPVGSHHELARLGLESGRHVFVEKPLCRTVAEARDLVELADRVSRHLCVGHVYLFHPAARVARQMIHGGELGTVRYVVSARTNFGPVRHDVNALWDLACHDVGIFLDWLGSDPISVTACGQSSLQPEIDDFSLATFTFPGGVLAHVQASWLSLRKVREITVVGESGMLTLDETDHQTPLKMFRHPLQLGPCLRVLDGWTESGAQIPVETVAIPSIDGEPLAHECRHFIDCVAGKSLPINSGRFALRVLEALDAADRSARNGSRQILVHRAAPPRIDDESFGELAGVANAS